MAKKAPVIVRRRLTKLDFWERFIGLAEYGIYRDFVSLEEWDKFLSASSPAPRPKRARKAEVPALIVTANIEDNLE